MPAYALLVIGARGLRASQQAAGAQDPQESIGLQLRCCAHPPLDLPLLRRPNL